MESNLQPYLDKQKNSNENKIKILRKEKLHDLFTLGQVFATCLIVSSFSIILLASLQLAKKIIPLDICLFKIEVSMTLGE
jgi:hypothetical protein